VLDELLAVTAKLTGEEPHEHRQGLKNEHQGKIDTIKAHTEKVHPPLEQMHPHAVDPPAEDPDLVEV
jgi:hypothetical protein